MERSDLKHIRLFLLDMDGTLYLGDRLFPFTVPLLHAIRSTGRSYRFLTNNSSKSVRAYVEKLRRLGIEANEQDFLTSSQATAYYLRQHYPDRTLYVCGTQSLKSELAERGLRVTEDPDAADCVVLGFDTELTFRKLDDVSRLLCTRDLPYIATHPDLCCPTEYGSVPDCGGLIEMLFYATGKRPFVVGKPAPLMVELAMRSADCTPDRTAVIGDRLYTDVKSGQNAHAAGILVLSGETTAEQAAQTDVPPDLILQNAGELLPYLTD